MSLAVKANIRGLNKLKRDLPAARKRFRKAHDTAIRIVAYRRLRDMAREIRKGAPGGRAYAPLSTISRFNSRNKSLISSRKPLTGLVTTRRQGGFLKGLPPIRYNAIAGGDGMVQQAEVGMTNRGVHPSGSWWIRAGNIWSSGGLVPVDEKDKRILRAMGADYKRLKPNSKIAKRFFLRKETKFVRHQRREIIGPFWRKWRQPTIVELNRVFKAKLAGKRV
jgi:hypothetical protein